MNGHTKKASRLESLTTSPKGLLKAALKSHEEARLKIWLAAAELCAGIKRREIESGTEVKVPWFLMEQFRQLDDDRASSLLALFELDEESSLSRSWSERKRDSAAELAAFLDAK